MTQDNKRLKALSKKKKQQYAQDSKRELLKFRSTIAVPKFDTLIGRLMKKLAFMNIIQHIEDKKRKRLEDEMMSDRNVGYIFSNEVAIRMNSVDQTYVMLRHDGTFYTKAKEDIHYDLRSPAVKLCNDESDVL